MIGLPSTKLGLDPGTANTLLYVKGRGVAVNEPSLVTIRTSTGTIEAVGGEAEAGLGRTPRKFQTARPVRAGIISDLKLFDGMLHRFLGKARISLHRLNVAIAVPSGMTEVERLAITESLRNAGAADVLLVDQVVAAARGAGLTIEESRGRMVVNIGAGVTDVAVISLANIVCGRGTRVAGDEMDAAITAHVRATHKLLIGERTAERLKTQIGSALPNQQELTLAIKGRCITRGVPREATVRGCEVREALSTPLAGIMNAIRETLDQAPPELSADLIETGIVLTGGSALLRDLGRFISRNCGLPVKVAENPLSCVILGLAHQVNHLSRYEWRRFGNGH
ncbi:MAG TPA: rod shape-determining protein [Bryobacteraceae bacterium]|nr:rod shape-determining protein [Bryobacteraceae bacterium]